MIDSPRNARQDMTQGSSEANAPSEDSLFDIVGLLFRRKWLIVLGLVVGLGLAGLYYFQATPIYESYAEILVMPKNSDLAMTNEQGSGGQQQLVDEGIMSTHVMLLQSRRIVESAIEKNKLTELPSIKEALETDSPDDPPKDPYDIISKQLTVSTGGEGNVKDARVLRATYEGPEKEDNVKIIKAIVDSYQTFLGDTFSDTNAEAVELIAKAKDSLGEELDALSAGYRKFRKDAPLMWNGEDALNAPQKDLEKIQDDLNETAQKRTETKSRLEVIREALAEKSIEELTDGQKWALLGESAAERLSLLYRPTPYSEAFRAEDPIRREKASTEYGGLLSLKLQEAALLEDYGPGSPKVQEVRRKILLTEDYLTKNKTDIDANDEGLDPTELLEAHICQLENDLKEMEKKQVDLAKRAEDAKKKAKELIDFELEGEEMKGEIDRKQVLYDAVIERLREMNLIKDYGGYITEVIAPAVVPTKKASPKLILVGGLGGVLGLFLGCGLAFLADVTDKTFRNPDEVCSTLDLPILAHVPTMPYRRLSKVKASSNGNGKPVLDPSLVAYHKPHSHQAESLRGLRTAINFGREGEPLKTIQVTSPNPTDGKTTVAANLAVVSANAGKRVLIIDCDMRRPRLNRVFGIKSDVGLSNVLNGEMELPDAIQATEIRGLWFLPCGPSPSNPSELLSQRPFSEMLEVLRDKYDLVILDTPPLLPVTDSTVVAPQVDGVILTVRITKNGGPGAIHARQLLDGVGAEVVGAVVNAVDENRQYQKSYYGQKYGYGYGKKYGYGSKYGKHGYGDRAEQEAKGQRQEELVNTRT